MRVVITNFGTTGDVLPLVTLGAELREHAHEVTMAFSPSHRPLIEANGFAFAPVGPDFSGLQDVVNQRWIADESVYTSPREMMQLLEPFQAALPQTYEELRRITYGSDVLISGPAQPAARMVHETTATPFVSVQFSNFGGSGTPALQAATAALINPVRQQLRLPPLANPVTLDANSPQLALYAMSGHVMRRGTSWPTHYHTVGFFVQPARDWIPDGALLRFLNAGAPPVIVSFGSMPHAEPQRLLDVIAEAAVIAGVRIVFQAGRAAVTPAASELLHVTGFVPHGWLFPRGSCIVLHGGAGTAASAFWSGRPTVYVPHGRIFDQHYWAELSRDLGCSGDPIPIDTLTAPRLAASIRATLDDQSRAAAASRLGALVRAEHGVKTARRLIEELVARVGLGEGVGWKTC